MFLVIISTNRIQHLIFACLAVMFFSGLNVSAQDDQGILTLDRLFTDNEFVSERFGPARWLEDGSGYTTLESSESEIGGREIVKYDPESGDRIILVNSEQLIPEGEAVPLQISDYHWSPDGSKLLIFTNTQRVWRYHTRGDYWVLDLKSGQLSQLGIFAEPSTMMFAKFSPDGKQAGYVVKHNIYVEDLATSKVKQLTFDGTEDLINGTFDWVYEEEFGLRDGFRWSPDSKSIAYWQLDASEVRDFYMINNTDSLYSYIIPVQYPKVGQTLSVCRVGVIPVEGGETVWMQLDGDPQNNYIARMEWAANSDEIIFQYLNRHQNTIQLMLGDAKTGEVNNYLYRKR